MKLLLLSVSLLLIGVLQAETVDEIIKRAKSVNSDNEKIEIYTTALKSHAENPQLYLERGIIYGTLKMHAQALADFSKVIALRPSHAIGYRNRALLYHRSKDYNASLQDCQKVLTLTPQDPFAHYLLGVNLANTGEIARAKDHIAKAIELNPEYKSDAAAKKIQNTAIKKEKSFSFNISSEETKSKIETKHLQNKIKNLIRKKQYDQAIELLKNADSAELLAERGLIHGYAGDFTNAHKDIQLALEKEPNCARTILYRGIIYAEAGNLDDAEKDLETALAIDKHIKRDFNYISTKNSIKRQRAKKK